MMKPKISTRYLTPQAKKARSAAKPRLLSDTEDAEGGSGFDEDLFQALLKCPEKKKLVLQLLAANKGAIKKHMKTTASACDKLKTNVLKCESPTALLRRRALEQMHTSPSPSNRSDSSRSRSSRTTEASSSLSSTVPFENILNGVVAYVEINSSQDVDRSGGAKSVLRSMGATVRETFTSDVTHVIFKDGLYTTFQKAKLKKVHLVSILWVEFCRKTSQRQNEKLYRAMRSEFDEESMVCSQMQKEYEDIIREEYRKSMVQGTPLPTTKSLIDRRKTLMTPTVTMPNVSSSSSSFRTAAETISSQELLDQEVASISGFQIEANFARDSLIMNDPACFSDTSGPLVNGSIVANCAEPMDCSDMDLTRLASKSPLVFDARPSKPLNRRKTICNSRLFTESPCLEKSTKKAESNGSDSDKAPDLSDVAKIACRTPRRLPESSNSSANSLISSDKTNCSSISSDKSSNLVDNVAFAVPKAASQRGKRLTRSSTGRSPNSPGSSTRSSIKSVESSDKSTNISDDVSKATSQRSRRLTRQSMSSLSESGSFIFGRNAAGSKQVLNVQLEKTASAMSELKLSSNLEAKTSAQTTTSMSALQLSSQSKNGNSAENSSLSVAGKAAAATDSSMSSLQISAIDGTNSPKKPAAEKTDSFESFDKSELAIARPVVEGIVRALQTPEFVTVRRRTRSESSASDDSEILSPLKRSKTRPRKREGFGRSEGHENEENLSSGERPNMSEGAVRKALVVNVGRSPLGALDNVGTPSEIRLKTLGTRGKRVVKREILAAEASKDLFKATVRRLYNPDDSVHIEVDDQKEREDRRNEIRKRKPDEGVFINPLAILTASNKTPSRETTSDSDCEAATPPKRIGKANLKADEAVAFDSSADEQRDLLAEVLTKKNEVQSRRRSTRIIKPLQKYSETVPVTPVKRRSTLDFMSRSQVASSTRKSKKKVDGTKLPTIVCTKLHKPDVQLFTQIVKKLGHFNIEDEVSERTTHVVAGESKRTINMLRAIARGCWIVQFEWVLQSLEAGKWLAEEDFEVADFSPTVQKCRLERQAFGARYTLDVFESCPPIYVAPSTNPRCSDLKELITTCKGKVVSAPRMAGIVVGQYLKQESTVCVNESWVLDSITFYKRMVFKSKYLVTGKRKSLAV